MRVQMIESEGEDKRMEKQILNFERGWNKLEVWR